MEACRKTFLAPRLEWIHPDDRHLSRLPSRAAGDTWPRETRTYYLLAGARILRFEIAAFARWKFIVTPRRAAPRVRTSRERHAESSHTFAAGSPRASNIYKSGVFPSFAQIGERSGARADFGVDSMPLSAMCICYALPPRYRDTGACRRLSTIFVLTEDKCERLLHMSTKIS